MLSCNEDNIQIKFIDFGLSYTSHSIEHKSVDINVLEKSL